MNTTDYVGLLYLAWLAFDAFHFLTPLHTKRADVPQHRPV